MGKVSKENVRLELMNMLAKITQTMPSATHKFALGTASALIATNASQYINDMLTPISDGEGYVDTEKARAVMYGGFDAAGGKIQVELFNGKGLLNTFVKPVTLTITKQDFDDLMANVETHCIKEASLSN